jgi:hypothetical protein
MELETGIQGLLQGDRYLFDDHRVTKYAKWTFDSQVRWLDTVAEARQAYTVSLNTATGAIRGEKLGRRFDDNTPYYDILVEA